MQSTGKRFQKISKHYLLTLPAIVNTEQEWNNFTRWLVSTDNRENILHREISHPEVTDLTNHQHAYFVFNHPHPFRRRPYYRALNGQEYLVHFEDNSNYSERTSDYSNWIKYIRKNCPDHKPLFSMSAPNYNEEEAMKELNAKKEIVKWPTAVANAMTMTNYQEAMDYLYNNNPVQFIQQKTKLKQHWVDAHAEEEELQQLQQKYDRLMEKGFINPWKENTIPVIRIRKWIKQAANTKERIKPLVIVGPAKTGKTDFVNREMRLKYNCFMVRGDARFTAFTEGKDYKFYIFDDAVIPDAEYVSNLKALISTYGTLTNMNVKYDMKRVPARPCCLVMNEGNYALFQRLIKRANEQEWWNSQLQTVYVDEPLFYSKKELDQLNRMTESPVQYSQKTEEDNDQITPEEDKDKEEFDRWNEGRRSRSSSRIRHEGGHVPFEQRFFERYMDIKGLNEDDEEIISLRELWRKNEEEKNERYERFKKWRMHSWKKCFDENGNFHLQYEDSNPSYEEEEEKEMEMNQPTTSGERFIHHENSQLTIDDDNGELEYDHAVENFKGLNEEEETELQRHSFFGDDGVIYD